MKRGSEVRSSTRAWRCGVEDPRLGGVGRLDHGPMTCQLLLRTDKVLSIESYSMQLGA